MPAINYDRYNNYNNYGSCNNNYGNCSSSHDNLDNDSRCLLVESDKVNYDETKYSAVCVQIVILALFLIFYILHWFTFAKLTINNYHDIYYLYLVQIISLHVAIICYAIYYISFTD